METVFPTTAPENPVERDKAIREMFAEMDRADHRIARTQREINRLKAETRAILKTLKSGS